MTTRDAFIDLPRSRGSRYHWPYALMVASSRTSAGLNPRRLERRDMAEIGPAEHVLMQNSVAGWRNGNLNPPKPTSIMF